MKFRVISGLPRSGSTLLCNLLAQNPKFSVSSTSYLCSMLHQLSVNLSAAPEIKSELAYDRGRTENRIRKALIGLVAGWYAHVDDPEKIIFDKSRSWSHNAALLFDLFPDSHLILCVRDLRGIFGSIEKQNSKFPIFSDAGPNPNERTLLSRADKMFAPEGIIGLPVHGIQDLLRRRMSNMSIVQYETFIARPKDSLTRLYAEMDEKWFDHDFENIESHATDLDALYLNKFPHEGCGKVESKDSDWKSYISSDIAGLIMQRYPDYNRAFGYV